MARTVYCRYDGCEGFQDVLAGVLPSVCDKCGRSARWATDPSVLKERRKHAKQPRVPFDLNVMDRRMLRSLRIAAD